MLTATPNALLVRLPPRTEGQYWPEDILVQLTESKRKVRLIIIGPRSNNLPRRLEEFTTADMAVWELYGTISYASGDDWQSLLIKNSDGSYLLPDDCHALIIEPPSGRQEPVRTFLGALKFLAP